MRQLERLNQLLEQVSTGNPLQQARLEGAGPLARLEDLRDLPFLDKQDLLADQHRHPPFGTNLTFPLHCYTQFNHTSGTTAQTLRILDTEDDLRWWATNIAEILRAAGVGPEDRVALAYSFGPYIQFWASYAGVREVGALAIPMGGMESVHRLHTIADSQATVLMATPSYAARLAKVAVAEGLESSMSSIKRVVCTGETGASIPAMREQIEAAWNALCFDHAGTSEAGPFAYPCAVAGGLHLNEEEFICELVEPSGATQAKPGEVAELVVTNLGRVGFPVIRYRTGDVVQASTDPCPAGHPGAWLPRGILGRTDDMVVVRGMNVFPSGIEQILRESTGVGEFRIRFYADPHAMDEVKVEVELADPSEARAIQARMKQRLGLRVRIVPVKLGVLPVRDGKAERMDRASEPIAGVQK